jgi:hypothetical protein
MYRKHLELVELRENAMAARARAARARQLAARSHHGSAAAFELQAATLEKAAARIEDQARHIEAAVNAEQGGAETGPTRSLISSVGRKALGAGRA